MNAVSCLCERDRGPSQVAAVSYFPLPHPASSSCSREALTQLSTVTGTFYVYTIQCDSQQPLGCRALEMWLAQLRNRMPNFI